jgi:Flp pilus assembly protein TadD
VIRFGASIALGRPGLLSRMPVWVPQLASRAGRKSAPRFVPVETLTASGYAGALQSARDALRAGRLCVAEDALMRASCLAGDDPAFFTLVGVLHECQGQTRAARKSYGRAIALHGTFAAAQQNMRRLYELATFGRAAEPIALGDELKDLAN